MSYHRNTAIRGWTHEPRVHNKYVLKCTVSPDLQVANSGGAVYSLILPDETYTVHIDFNSISNGFCARILSAHLQQMVLVEVL